MVGRVQPKRRRPFERIPPSPPRPPHRWDHHRHRWRERSASHFPDRQFIHRTLTPVPDSSRLSLSLDRYRCLSARDQAKWTRTLCHFLAQSLRASHPLHALHLAVHSSGFLHETLLLCLFQCSLCGKFVVADDNVLNIMESSSLLPAFQEQSSWTPKFAELNLELVFQDHISSKPAIASSPVVGSGNGRTRSNRFQWIPDHIRQDQTDDLCLRRTRQSSAFDAVKLTAQDVDLVDARAAG